MKMLKQREAAAMLRISTRTLRRITAEGHLTHYKFRGLRAPVYALEDIEAYRDAGRVPAMEISGAQVIDMPRYRRR